MKARKQLDMLCLAALTENYWFVTERLNTIIVDSSRTSQIAWYTVASSPTAGVQLQPDWVISDWYVRDWDQVYLLTALVRLGADPNATDQTTSIWQEVLSFLYRSRSSSKDFPKIQDFLDVINAFLEAGAHERATFTFQVLGALSGVTVLVDFHRVPLIGQNKEEDWLDSDHECLDQFEDEELPKDAPHVRFSSDSGTKVFFRMAKDFQDYNWCALWSAQGRRVSPRENLQSNRMVRAWLDATTEEETEERLHATIAWFQKTFLDDCEVCQKLLSLSTMNFLDGSGILRRYQGWMKYLETLRERAIPDE